MNKQLKKSFLLVPVTLTLAATFSLSDLANERAYAAGYTNTKWQYHYKANYSTKAEKTTVASIAVAVTPYLPWRPAQVAVGVAGIYYADKRKTVITTTKYYRKFANINKYFKPLAGEKRVVYFYKDAARKHLINKQTQYKYTEWYVK